MKKIVFFTIVDAVLLLTLETQSINYIDAVISLTLETHSINYIARQSVLATTLPCDCSSARWSVDSALTNYSEQKILWTISRDNTLDVK